MNELDLAFVRQLVDFDLQAGLLWWRERPEALFSEKHFGARANARRWNANYAGKPAGTKCKFKGYWSIRIARRRYLTHRVIWALANGRWPENEIDHINGDPQDNRLCNLREVSHLENSRNKARPISNRSGRIGVNWDANARKWAARIKSSHKEIFLGLFPSFEEACAARREAEIEHGFHPNHGRDNPFPPARNPAEPVPAREPFALAN